jgi:hypothetical protein
MFLTKWLRPRTEKTHQPRTLLGVQQLEDRTVPSWLAQIGTGPGDIRLAASHDMDAAGNVYVCGTYNGTTDFDPGPGTTPHMTTSDDRRDGFLAKYSPAGALLWAKRFGGADQDSVDGVSVDPTGQWVYATGTFLGSADFTGDGLADKTSAGLKDQFVVKLNAGTGTTDPNWGVRTIASVGDEIGGDIAVTASHVYVTGGFSGSADFDPGPGTRILTPAGGTAPGKGKPRSAPGDAFLLKLDTAGNHVSSGQIGGTATSEHGNSLVADGDTVYLSGRFNGTADFDPGAAVTNRTSAGDLDLFLASYSTAPITPTLNWVQVLGNAGYQNAGRLADDSSSLYFTGEFTGTMDFDPGPGISNLTAVTTYSDIYVARYSKAGGSLAWVKGFGGPGNDFTTVTPVVDEATGVVYVGGSFQGQIDLNPNGLGGEQVSPTGNDHDGFLVKLATADGAYQNSWQSGGSGYDGSIRPIGVRAGTLYATGWFEGTATFPTGGALTSQGMSDLFLMALDQFSAGPVVAGSSFTLSASNFVDTNPATTTTEMAFYADSNGDGVLAPATDTLLGYGTQTASGTWTITIAFPTAGTYRLFAQGRDNFDSLSSPLSLDFQVQ